MYQFKIENMNCMSCFHNMEDALKEYDSSIEAKVDLKNQILTVESQHPVEKLAKLLEAAGYPVIGVAKL